MPDSQVVIEAAGEFWMAWIAATRGDPLPPTDPAVVEVHEAAVELIRATERTDLRAAYDVIDELVSRFKLPPPAYN
jgi:hypothetical protein